MIKASSVTLNDRRLLILKLLAEIKSSTQQILATQIVKKVNLLNAVLLIKEAWNKVNNKTIKNCFKNSKFYSDVSGLVENN